MWSPAGKEDTGEARVEPRAAGMTTVAVARFRLLPAKHNFPFRSFHLIQSQASHLLPRHACDRADEPSVYRPVGLHPLALLVSLQVLAAGGGVHRVNVI